MQYKTLTTISMYFNSTRELKDLFGANTKQALLKTDKFDDLDGTATIRSRRYTNIG